MSLEVKSISKYYGTQKALDEVSFTVQRGEIIGLLGPNGAGKSTLMKILTGYIPPSSGTASVMGFDVVDRSLEVRRRVGYLPEQNPLYAEMYICEFLKFVSGIYRQSGSRVLNMEDVMHQCGLTPERHKKIGQLSKGYRQRVGLAQALLHDPDVLILDEPTSGLDPNQLQEIRTLIRTVGRDKTVLLSTHIMQEVEVLCQRAVIINKGRIVADQPTSKLLEQTAERQIVLVEFDQHVDQALLEEIPGVEEVFPLTSNNWKLAADPANDIRPEVFRFAVDRGIAVLSMQKQAEKLEEVFRDLTR